jgi:hypothetical protein
VVRHSKWAKGNITIGRGLVSSGCDSDQNALATLRNSLHPGTSGTGGRVRVSGSYSFLAIAQRASFPLLVGFLPFCSTGFVGHRVET